MKKYAGSPPFTGIWSAERHAEFRSKGIGTINMGSRLKARNSVSEEIDRIISERLTLGEDKHS
ncbi:MAG: hypothetical protein GY846_11180 [Deltaproteobacteria bacterium]|nr:hypothetical protein [Deltaproteobacteria bacterium]